MKLIFTLFKKYPFLLIHVSLFASAFFSFRYYIERFLFPRTGMGWAYVIDQTVPLAITLLVTFLFLLHKKSLEYYITKLESHRLLLVLIFITALVTHLGILRYYFFAEEPVFVLEAVTQNREFHFHNGGTATLRGYFLAFYILSYLLFGINAWAYQILNVIYFAVSALFVYWFVYLLTNRKLISAPAAIFFATSPAYLDMFTWQNSSYAPVFILGLVSLIFLMYYNKNGKFAYYLLSLAFFFCTVKMGFVRSAGLAFIPLFLLFSPITGKAINKPMRLVAHGIPYIAIAIYFVLFEFMNSEFRNTLVILSKSGDYLGAFRGLLNYREASNNPYLLNKLVFFTTYLFIPGGLIGDLLPRLRPLFQNVSIVLVLGKLILLALVSAFFVALKYRHSKTGWLVIFALAFIFLNMLYSVIGYQGTGGDFDPKNPIFASLLDKRFSREDVGYGPGSRYLFVSSLGVSLLFGLMFAKHAEFTRKLFKRVIILTLLILIIAINSYFTVRAQINNFKGIALSKSLVQNIFNIVPRDGKPKLLLSINPESNSLDRKWAGWEWLHGFYKKQELVYAANLEEAARLLKNGQYRQENLYAFYVNTHTLAFADVSKEARNYFFADLAPLASRLPDFENRVVKSKTLDYGGDETNALERAVIESGEISQRSIGAQLLKFKIRIKRQLEPPYPFSDAIFDQPYIYNFPLQLWDWDSRVPWEISDLNTLDGERQSKTQERKSRVLDIFQERRKLMDNSRVTVSTIEPQGFLASESMIDGLYTTYPNPRNQERYYIARENFAVVNLDFPYIAGIRRILLNTPYDYAVGSPKKITIYSSTDNRKFHEVITRENLTPEGWSPNRGLMIRLDLPKTIDARSLKLEITANSGPVVLDEIVIEDELSVAYSPQDIHNTVESAYRYVRDKDTFEQLTKMSIYDRLTLLWACAEDPDWQKQLKSKLELVPGVWNIRNVELPSVTNELEISAPIDCKGSVLRKIFFISPPYPVEMEVIEAMVE